MGCQFERRATNHDPEDALSPDILALLVMCGGRVFESLRAHHRQKRGSAIMPDLSLFQAGATLEPDALGCWRTANSWAGNPDDPLPTATSRTESGGTGATLPARTAGAAPDMET